MARASESVQSLGGLALVMVVIHTFFWIALVLMMGPLFESSGGVIAVPLGLYVALWMLSGMIPGLVYVSPLPPRVLVAVLLTFSPDPEQMNALSTSFMIGEPVFSWLPLISTVVLCVAFIAVSIWRFNRQEF